MAKKLKKIRTEVKTKNPLSNGFFDEAAARDAMKLVKKSVIFTENIRTWNREKDIFLFQLNI